MTLQGKVLSVETRNLSEPAVADAAISDTTLYVADASTFDENGGLVTVGGEPLAYSATDVDLNTLTLTVPLVTAVADQDLVEVYPPTPVKTALVDLGDLGGDAIPATVPHTLLDKFPDGTRDDTAAESVTLEQRGPYEFVLSDAVAEPLNQVSLDYTPSETGIGLSADVAQFSDIQSLGTVAAAAFSADTMSIGGVDFQAILDALPQGKLVEGRKSSGTAAGAIGATEVALFVINCGSLLGGRQYRLVTQFHFQMTGTVTTDQYTFRFRYTLDGSDPTVSSALVPNTKNDHRIALNQNSDVFLSMPFDLAADASVNILMTGERIVGSTTGTIYQGGSTLPLIMSLYDEGAIGSLSTTAIKQRLGLSEGLPLSTYTKTFNAIWANGNDNYSNSLTNSWLWIGIDDNRSEASYGLVGFDSTAIVSALSGSVTPTQCTLRWRPRSRAASDGLDVRILSHNYASLAASTSGFAGWDYTLDTGGLTSLTTKLNAAPGVLVDTALGTSVFNQFKAGSKKGVAFAGVSGSAAGSSGSVYGDGANQCQLIFTYQGTS